MPTAAYVWRDFVIDGDPASGINPPAKVDIRAWGAQLEGASGIVPPPIQDITTTPQTILPTAQVVFFNVPSAASATLPDAAAWRASAGVWPLLLKDYSGLAAKNNITIHCAGAATVDGQASFQIRSNWGYVALRVTSSNNWAFVG
jgi:hypothetical protein